MKDSLETRLGMFVALALIAGFIIIEVLGVPNFFKPAYRLRALFNNTQELKVGDPVKMAGVPVGRVEKIGLTTNKGEGTLPLNRDTPVHTATKATLPVARLLG